MLLNGLQIAMDNCFFHPEYFEETVVEYVRDHDGDPVRLYQESLALSDFVARGFIGLLASSTYNIFQPWYKSVLIYFQKNRNGNLKSTASDILYLYQNIFNEIGELDEIQ